jgi:hypothetical protein
MLAFYLTYIVLQDFEELSYLKFLGACDIYYTCNKHSSDNTKWRLATIQIKVDDPGVSTRETRSNLDSKHEICAGSLRHRVREQRVIKLLMF